MRALARESLKLVKDNAPQIVSEQIITRVIDEVDYYITILIGKLTNIDPEDDRGITMAHGIIRDGLLREVIKQIENDMLSDADKRITKLFKK